MDKILLDNIKNNFKDMAYFEEKVKKQLAYGLVEEEQLEKLKEDNYYKSQILLNFIRTIDQYTLGNHAYKAYLIINNKEPIE